MTEKDFKRVLGIIKGIKCHTYIIFPDKIVGTDASFTSVYEVYTDTTVNGIYEFRREMLDTFLKESKQTITNMEVIFGMIADRYTGISNLNRIYTSAKSLLHAPNYAIPDLKLDMAFTDIMSLKADDGAKLYKINEKYMFYLFPRLLPLNKNDTISLELVDVNESSFLGKFIINKGSYTINEYIKFVYLRRVS